MKMNRLVEASLTCLRKIYSWTFRRGRNFSRISSGATHTLCAKPSGATCIGQVRSGRLLLYIPKADNTTLQRLPHPDLNYVCMYVWAYWTEVYGSVAQGCRPGNMPISLRILGPQLFGETPSDHPIGSGQVWSTLLQGSSMVMWPLMDER